MGLRVSLPASGRWCFVSRLAALSAQASLVDLTCTHCVSRSWGFSVRGTGFDLNSHCWMENRQEQEGSMIRPPPDFHDRPGNLFPRGPTAFRGMCDAAIVNPVDFAVGNSRTDQCYLDVNPWIPHRPQNPAAPLGVVEEAPDLNTSEAGHVTALASGSTGMRDEGPCGAGEVPSANTMTSISPATRAPADDLHASDDGRPAAKRRKRASTPGASRPSPRELGIMRKDDASASFLGSSSGIHFVRTVYQAFARRSADLRQARAGHESLVPGEDDHLRPGHGRAGAPLWRPQELDFTNPSLPFETLIQLSENYFQNWHPVYPFLHAPSVLRTMDRMSQGGIQFIPRSDAAIIRSIFSISAIDARQVQATSPAPAAMPAELVFQTAHDAMNGLRDLLDESSCIASLQAAFSIQLFLTSILHLNAASRIGGFVTRTAFHLGLHRCPARYSCFTRDDVAIRRRLFWSIYCLERYLTQALGVPLSIRDDDIDVCYPGAERHQTDSEDVMSCAGNGSLYRTG